MNFGGIGGKKWCIYINIRFFYYAPPSRPEGPRRRPDRGNAGDALVFLMLLWLLYAMGVYTYQKIHLGKLGSSQ